MNRRDKELIFDGQYYKVVYFQDFIAKPFGVVDKLADKRVFSFQNESAALEYAKDADERIKQYAN